MAASSLRLGRFRDQITVHELPHDQAHALVNDRLRQDQERQRDQQAQVNVHVVQERHGDAIAPGEPLAMDNSNSGSQASIIHTMTRRLRILQRVPGESRAPPELIQRPAENQREVGWFLHGGPGASGRGEARTKR